MMKLTEEQQAIIQENVQDALCVIAYAGCGKTSTLLEYARARKSSRILYMAFNRAMASEAQDKFRMERHVTARTVHSLAYSRIGHRYRESLGELRPMDILEFAEKYFKAAGRTIFGYNAECQSPKGLGILCFLSPIRFPEIRGCAFASRYFVGINVGRNVVRHFRYPQG